MSSPAEPGYAITKLFQEISDLRAAVKRLEQTPPPVSVDQATVIAYAGSTTCVVQYDVSGATRSVAFLSGYSPSLGDQVEVFSLPGRVLAMKPYTS